MNELTTLGLDLAKNGFHPIGCDASGKEEKRKRLTRRQLHPYLGQLDAPCRIAMAACGSAHNRARQLKALDHAVRLIPLGLRRVQSRRHTSTSESAPNPTYPAAV